MQPGGTSWRLMPTRDAGLASGQLTALRGCCRLCLLQKICRRAREVSSKDIRKTFKICAQQLKLQWRDCLKEMDHLEEESVAPPEREAIVHDVLRKCIRKREKLGKKGTGKLKSLAIRRTVLLQVALKSWAGGWIPVWWEGALWTSFEIQVQEQLCPAGTVSSAGGLGVAFPPPLSGWQRRSHGETQTFGTLCAGSWYFIWNRGKNKSWYIFSTNKLQVDTDPQVQEKLPWDLQESHRLLSSRTNTGRKITGADGIAQRGREGWTLLVVTGSSVATPKTKLRAGARLSTHQNVLYVITCFSTSIRKGSWKTGMDSRGIWKRIVRGKYS